MGSVVHSVEHDVKHVADKVDHVAKAGIADVKKGVVDFVKVDALMKTDITKYLKTATAAEKIFVKDATVAAHKMGPDFKLAEGIAKTLGKDGWKGIADCEKSPPCKAAAEKYGMVAVKDGMAAEAKQQLIIILI